MKRIDMLVSRRVSILLLLVTVLLCGLLTSNLGAEITPLPNNMGLEYSLETDKTIYQLGETVYAIHTITNPHDFPVDVEFRQAPGFDLWVMQGDSTIWAREAFAAVIWTRTFAPGEVFECEYTWDMTDFDGNVVLPGEYELFGAYACGYDSTCIIIVPEPATVTLMGMAGMYLALFQNRRRRATILPVHDGI